MSSKVYIFNFIANDTIKLNLYIKIIFVCYIAIGVFEYFLVFEYVYVNT